MLYMKKKPLIILILFSLLTLSAALWQGYEAAVLHARLESIDQNAQRQRLLELSLHRIEPALKHLLATERAKLGPAPNLQSTQYAPQGERADFNCGFFLLTPAGLQVPAGEENFGNLLQGSPTMMNTLRRKAFNPAAPVFDPAQAGEFDAKTQLPVFGVYEVDDPDFSRPMEAKGTPGPFFAWNYGENLVYMRSVPTTHGHAAEGFVIDAAKLAAHLRPLVEEGLPQAEIGFVHRGEPANLTPLPLVLRPGEEVQLADAPERKQAMRGTVAATWLITILSIAVIFGLLAFYARMERRRSDFVSAVTHELRTPLTSFCLITENLKEGRVPAEKVQEYHESLYRESRRLGHLVENVLSFAKLSRGKVRGRQDSGGCRDLLNNALEKPLQRMREAGFHVNVTHDARCDLVNMHTDLLSLEQIFTNLADNAVKYAATAPQPAVNISVVRHHDSLAVRFSDNGPGIAEELQRQLFRPFSRSAKAVSGRKPGVGLGLALSRDIARSIGGELALEKTGEKGSVFILTLPLI